MLDEVQNLTLTLHWIIHKTKLRYPLAIFMSWWMMVSSGISFQKEEELLFIKSCLFYLKEGIRSEHVINMAMVDYLTESWGHGT
jgi:hypothetical protein